MQLRQQFGHAPLRYARGADAEQRVDAQVLCAQHGRFVGEGDLRRARALQRGAGVGRQAILVAQPRHHGVHAPLAQVQGGFQPVAAVVAGAAGDPDRARMRRQCQRQPRRGQAGALHQRVRRQRGLGRGLDAARGGQVEQRGGAVERQQVGHGPLWVERAGMELMN